MRASLHRICASLIAAGLASGAAAAATPPTLEQQFAKPEAGARPRVWWHWIDGNVTRDGITRDLEWMKRSGIAGFQMFDVGRGFPALVPQPATYQSPQWQALLKHTASETDRLGLEMTLASAPGWSETGGPSVRPESAMKKLVWSEARLHGGQPYSGALPLPPTVNGPYQDLPPKPDWQLNGEPKGAAKAPTETYYADTRVIAYRLPAAQAAGELPTPTVSASGGEPDAQLLRDGRYDKAFVMPVAGEGRGNWVQFDFGAAVTLRSLRLGITWPEGNASPMPAGSVEASDDGGSFRTVAQLPASSGTLPLYTLALPATTARYFRLAVKPGSGFSFPGLPMRSITEFRFTEIDFSDAARPNRQQLKAAFAVSSDYDSLASAPVDSDAAIDPSGVIDISAHMDKDGTLDWTPPAGEWSVIRFGYSLTGQANKPATQAGTGFEVDKYSAREVRGYLDQYYGGVLRQLGKLSGTRGLQAVLTDSWEAGQANWTPAMIEEFRARRGYDPLPWLPVLADHVVGSAQDSDRFLWDFRRTLADMIAENHYKTIADYAREHGLGYYGEAMGVDLPATGDGLQDKRYPTVPMGEFWQVPPDKPSGANHIADVREAASAAHVYGQNIVATESFTGFPLPGNITPYQTTPWLLKPLADRFMAQGVNRFIIHTAVHQPLERGPGFSLSIFGQYFSRLETWGEMASGWMDYLARSSQMLQQGRYAADIAYFYGEGAAATVPAGAVTDPVMPQGYAFDFVCRDMLLRDFTVTDGRLLAPSGTSYKLLVLPSSTTRLTLPLVNKLRELVNAGAVLVGPRPSGAAGLANSDAQVNAATAELWGDLDGKTRTVRNVGKGRVYWGQALADVFAAEKLAPDTTFKGEGADKIVSIHRQLPQGEIYFVANQGSAPAKIEADLRVSGREAELWHADTASIEPAAFRQQNGRTTVSLALGPYESVFVVLRKPTRAPQSEVPAIHDEQMAELDGRWTLGFMPDRGAPASIKIDSLESWSSNADPGVRYYAGIGTYSKTIVLPRKWFIKGQRMILDLGEVHEVAHVSVNGKDAGIAWKPPYRIDLAGLVSPGENTLTVEVANLWPNRMIGDAQPDAKRAYAFSTFDYYIPGLLKLPYGKDTPLLPSGLIGPVKIFRESHQ